MGGGVTTRLRFGPTLTIELRHINNNTNSQSSPLMLLVAILQSIPLHLPMEKTLKSQECKDFLPNSSLRTGERKVL